MRTSNVKLAPFTNARGNSNGLTLQETVTVLIGLTLVVGGIVISITRPSDGRVLASVQLSREEALELQARLRKTLRTEKDAQESRLQVVI